MLFNNDLWNTIFNKNNSIDTDELIIISGYISPSPVKNLKNLPLKCTVIYGMYQNSISEKLHSSLLEIDSTYENINIFYSIPEIHSKCYIWKNKGKIVYALIGSANFTMSGLNKPLRETLCEVKEDAFSELDEYLENINGKLIHCSKVNILPNNKNIYEHNMFNNITNNTMSNNSNININCNMVLYDPRTNEVPLKSGLNWFNSPGHTSVGDAYIPIRVSYIKEYPNLFPPKQMKITKTNNGGKANRQNDPIDLIWDDGETMSAILEGSQTINDTVYPKNLSSFPNKNTLGLYIRKRLNLDDESIINISHLKKYGRTDITLSLIEDGIYYADFSVK